MEITKQTNIAKLLTEKPELAEIFVEKGMHCAGCMAATFDSIEDGAKAHGFSDSQIEKLVEDLQKAQD